MALKDLWESLTGWFAPGEPSDAPLAEEVLTRHAGRLMRMRGVMSVSVGRTSDGRAAIVVGLTNPLLAASDEIPESIDGVPVLTSEIGRMEPRDDL